MTPFNCSSVLFEYVFHNVHNAALQFVGELGDYDPTTHTEGYLSGFQFVPNQVC